MFRGAETEQTLQIEQVSLYHFVYGSLLNSGSKTGPGKVSQEACSVPLLTATKQICKWNAVAASEPGSDTSFRGEISLAQGQHFFKL